MNWDYLLFEEAIGEILAEEFGDRSLAGFDEADTESLHKRARQRVFLKHAGLYDSKVLSDYVRTYRAH